jgi:hypothetical protein
VQFDRGDDGPGTTGGPGPATGEAGATSGGEDPTTGVDPTTGGSEEECDLWAQDCPEGSKCMPYDKDGDSVFDEPRCVPLDSDPGQGGDDCHIEGTPASGLDDCDEGLICWNVDAMNQGACVIMCAGSESAPTCPEGLICDISNGGALILCVTPCDPLAPACPEGQICLPSADGGFVCDADASGSQGGYGDPCAYVNVCDNGLLCAPGPSVPGCATDGCCTEYCDLTVGPENCSGAPEQECVPFHDPGAAPPGYEDVGVCSVPL